jgi:hypothetical protein
LNGIADDPVEPVFVTERILDPRVAVVRAAGNLDPEVEIADIAVRELGSNVLGDFLNVLFERQHGMVLLGARRPSAAAGPTPSAFA